MKKACKTARRSPLKFYDMGNKPLAYDVKCKNKVVIPAGTKGVQTAFRRSHLQRLDESTGEMVNLNVYLYRGRMYHA